MENRNCQNCKDAFAITAEDSVFYERMKVPAPTFCPACRQRRRFLFLNQRKLFRRRDASDGNEIYSMLSPQSPYQSYKNSYWFSDQWDSSAYARDYDFSRSFFAQFRELALEVPMMGRSADFMVNSDYCNQCGWLRDCYLVFEAAVCERVAYAVRLTKSKDSMDLYDSDGCELCYEGTGLERCYRTMFSVDCWDCTDVWYSKDCSGCTFCFGCANLRNRSYYIFNKPHTKEEYFEKLKAFDTGSRQMTERLRERAESFWSKFPEKFMLGLQNVDVTGDRLYNVRNVREGFMVQDAEHHCYAEIGFGETKDAYDVTNILGGERLYESVSTGLHGGNLKFVWECWDSVHDIEYSMFCRNASDLFGCAGLRNKSYCILNKQYSKDDYAALREKIIFHMRTTPYQSKNGQTYGYGEFFPPEFSPYGYNETIAQDFFPLEKSTAERYGYLWYEPEPIQVTPTKDTAELPDSIRDIGEEVVNEILRCSACRAPYRVIPMEFRFLKQFNLPIPRKCPECRFQQRLTFVNPPVFTERQCMCAGATDAKGIYTNVTAHAHGSAPCPERFKTSYPKEHIAIVYCGACYNAEVV